MPQPPRTGPAARPPQPPGRPANERTGTLRTVPCPWCNAKIDFGAHVGEELGGVGTGSIGVEVGSVFECDNTKCKKLFRISRLERITMVGVVPFTKPLTRR